jgi:hypothetical protein
MSKKKVPPKRAVTKAPANLRKDAEQALLRRHVPAALVIDPDLNVVHFHGDTAPIWPSPPGRRFQVLKMVRPEFLVQLRRTITKAKQEGITIIGEIVRFEHNGQRGNARLEVSLYERPPARSRISSSSSRTRHGPLATPK